MTVAESAAESRRAPLVESDRGHESAQRLGAVIAKLEAYCRAHDWTGYDPYDALNSEMFAGTPLASSRIARLALTQLLKRSPVNLRPVLRVRPQRDPKATALFLAAYLRQACAGSKVAQSTASLLTTRLLELRSPSAGYSCWGYSFPWQTRHRLVPRSAPNLVTTVFAADALLDAYEFGLGGECLDAALSAGKYLSEQLYWEDGSRAGFAYPLPDIRIPVHNANLLGAALLCRLARISGDTSALAMALRVTRFSAGSQREDGSWAYGVGSTQQWVDNFHTGYNLVALHSINRDVGTDEFDAALSRGFWFYRSHFFTENGVAKYFHNRTYPIDIHSVAQSVITLRTLRYLDPEADALARLIVSWALTHMWDAHGFFHYRVLRGLKIRTSYMRWSQAWMLLALASLDRNDQSGVQWTSQPRGA